jgi:predicted nucleotidyltransferase
MAMGSELLAKDPRLAEVVQRLIEAYAPERIYLFGSVARGEAGPDSDYDLLIVVPDTATPEQKNSAKLPDELHPSRQG